MDKNAEENSVRWEIILRYSHSIPVTVIDPFHTSYSFIPKIYLPEYYAFSSWYFIVLRNPYFISSILLFRYERLHICKVSSHLVWLMCFIIQRI